MARSITGPERALLQGTDPIRYHARVFVRNDLVLQDMTAYLSTNWFRGARISGSIDDPVDSAEVVFLRSNGTDSLMPLVSSAAHANGILLQPRREIKIQVAVTPPAVAPVSGDWRTIFWGYIDSISTGGRNEELITARCRDLGSELFRVMIEAPQLYPISGESASLEQVLQEMLNTNGFGSTILSVVNGTGSPSGTASGITVQKFQQRAGVSLYEAMLELVNQTGWSLRYVFTGADAVAFRLYLLDRAKIATDVTIPPSEYFDVQSHEWDGTSVRNALTLQFLDLNGDVQTITSTDATSITKYGRRPIVLGLDQTDRIKTITQAQDFAARVLSDLREPKATHRIISTLLWQVERGDLVNFPSNAVHHSTGQSFAVSDIQHSLSEDGMMTTELGTRGQPASLFDGWLRKEGRSVVQSVYTTALVEIVAQTATTVTYRISASSPAGSPLVAIRSLTNATIASSNPGGYVIGTFAASGLQVTINRPAASTTVALMEVEAALAGAVTDTDTQVIPPQGTDILQLIVSARIESPSPTQCVVRVAVTDPIPQGANTLTLTLVPAGQIAVTPAGPITVTSGSTYAFTVLRPPVGSGNARLRVVLTANSANRVFDEDAVDIEPRDLLTQDPGEATVVAVGMLSPPAGLGSASFGNNVATIPFQFPAGSTAEYAEVFAQEHLVSPSRVSVAATGKPIAGLPLVKGDGRSSFDIRYVVPSSFLLFSVVPYDALGRRGPVVNCIVSTPAAVAPPNGPDLAENVSTSSDGTQCVNRVRMPSTNLPDFIRTLVNGIPSGSDVSRAGTAAGAFLTLPAITGLTPQSTNTYRYQGVSAGGLVSSTFAEVTVTQPQPTIPTPTLAFNPPIFGDVDFNPILAVVLFSITQGAGAPAGVIYEFEWSDNGTTWNRDSSADGSAPSITWRTFANVGAVRNLQARIRGTKPGHISSALSNVVSFTVPARENLPF